ncbi:TIM-barrel domain-containing protein [Changchengzhania lutea]|uniref:TIM-barrel domain-containing protein n=1 Tax=Changchengzhania lutea TaxID=2049305 RepID=UPI001FE78F1B|nr:TIM-barrel domain-containing protein [Changchengzhania lutea]
MTKVYFNIIVFLLSISCLAQNKDRDFVSAKVHEDKILKVEVSDGEYHIQFYSTEIVETTFVPSGEALNNSSHAVVLTPSVLETHHSENELEVLFKTKGLSVTIQKKPFQISYNNKGKSIISEKAGYVKNDSLETIEFNIAKDEVLYGGGARALGMNRRGHRLQLYNRAHYGYETTSELMNFTIPIAISSNKYMLHFDNAPIGFLDLDSQANNTLRYETISGRKTYQIIVGDSWYELIDNYTNLTGKQPMIPRWALGNFSSRFGYHSQKETEATIDKFIKDSIPVDAIILDLYWFGKALKGTMGNLEFLKDSFPNPKQMIANLKSKHVNTILITEPFILTTSKRWDEAVKADILAKDTVGKPFTYEFYFGNTGLIDIYNPKGKTWFKNIYKELGQMGVTGFWGDLGEPEVHPSELQHATGTADEVHNIYGHHWAQLVYEANKDILPENRPFILMRAGYSGSQHYGLIPWSGDVNRTWGGLQSQPEIALQMSMQGLAYMHSDLGGFAGANLDDELYVRWLQYGVFQPIYRPHAQEDVPSEPIFRSTKAKNLARTAIELRYKMLPYNYNLVYENNQFGKPLMRPLFFEEPNNVSLKEYSEAYLWGHDFLIAPILEAAKKAQQVYFPRNNNWFDFYTDKKIKGGQTLPVSTRESSIPTFVRGGAFVPLSKVVQNTESYNPNDMELHYYYDESIKASQRTFYNDDGKMANAIEKGLYEKLYFEADIDIKKNILEIEYKAEKGAGYQSSTKNLNLMIHNINRAPKKVKMSGRRLDFFWDSQKNLLTIPSTWNTVKDIEIKIKFK